MTMALAVVFALVCACWSDPVSASALLRTTSENVTSCAGVKPIFETKNISASIPDVPVSGAELRVCEVASAGASCCTRDMEDSLRVLVRRDFQSLLHHNSRSLEGLLAATAVDIREHVSSLARQSQNRTHALLAQVYPGAAAQVREPVASLYADILWALDPGSASSSSSSSSSSNGLVYTLGAPADVSVEESVGAFFARLFPLVFRHAAAPHPRRRALAPDYAACLRATASELQPFGDVPRQLATSVGRTLEATRVLLQALWLGVEVLNSTDSLPLAGDCHAALLRMTYCARCAGLPEPVKPCVGYCLNVLRGCLTQHASELDLPWNGFVEATERLATAVRERDPERVIRGLHARVTEAIMYAVENGAQLDKKVKRACGPTRYADVTTGAGATSGPGEGEVTATTATTASEAAEAAAAAAAAAAAEEKAAAAPEVATSTGAENSADSLSSRLRLLLASLGRSRGFYANLAESLCSDDSFAETRDTADCWNGQRLGEYSKMVVSSSISAQKYNPELAWSQRSPDPRIAQLSDKLRHIRQVVLSQLTQAPQSGSFLKDGEGSGSGGGEHWTDEEEEWVDQGSGSGIAPYPETGINTPGGRDTQNEVAGGVKPSVTVLSFAARTSPSVGFLLIAALSVLNIHLVPALAIG